jgi:hypothetical protein
MAKITFSKAVEVKSETGEISHYRVYPIRDGLIFKVTDSGKMIGRCSGKTPEEALENARKSVIEAGEEI